MQIVTGSGAGPDAVTAIDTALRTVTLGLDGARCHLAAVFVGGSYRPVIDELRSAVVTALNPDHVVGVTAQGVVADGAEVEHPESVVVWAAHLPGVGLSPLRFAAPTDGMVQWTPPPDDARALLLLADPFTTPAESLLAWLQQARPGLAVVGGLASGASTPGGNRLLLDDQMFPDGAVALAISGEVRVRTLVSQGCRPVGSPLVITDAERNIIRSLAGAPAADRIREAFAEADQETQELMRMGLHVGVVIDEYAESFEPGDFLVRAVIGAEPGTGAVAVGETVEVGQTVQFHVRDAASADEDLRTLLDVHRSGARPSGALLFTCNGRGSGLFGVRDHDAGLIREALGDPPLAGFFCAGEFGPIGSRSFLHGFTASLLTFA